MSAQVRGVLWGWHRCAAYKGSRQKDKQEKAFKLSPSFFKYTLGPWTSIASLRVLEAASQRPHARTTGQLSLGWMWKYGPEVIKKPAQTLLCVCWVAHLCPTLWNPMDCSLTASCGHADSPGKNTGLGFHAFLLGIFPTPVLNPGLPHWRQILHYLSH